jgi:hypothetical protein
MESDDHGMVQRPVDLRIHVIVVGSVTYRSAPYLPSFEGDLNGKILEHVSFKLLWMLHLSCYIGFHVPYPFQEAINW